MVKYPIDTISYTLQAPSYLIEQLVYVGDVQPYHLRNTEDFRLSMATTTCMQRGIFFIGLKVFNMLPEFIKAETNFNL